MKILVSVSASGFKPDPRLPRVNASKVEDDLNKIAGSHNIMSTAHTEGICKFLLSAPAEYPKVYIADVCSLPVTAKVSYRTGPTGKPAYAITVTVNGLSVTIPNPRKIKESRKLLAAAVNVWFDGRKGFKKVE